MNLNKNYYSILGVTKLASEKDIKKAYYKLSFQHHPDRGGDQILFTEITEAYDVLSSESRVDYDLKSKYGCNYNEYFELFNIDMDFDYDKGKDSLEKFKKNDVLNIYIKVDDTFDGTVEYERWVKCKPCDGSGKDLSSKIVIKDNDGNILKTFDADDGCDFCFEKDNFVITKRGPIKINNVKIGDLVLSKNNNYHEVTHLISRDYTGDLYDINVSGIEVNGVTPNHKFNIVRFNRNKQGRVKINDYQIMEIPAGELTKDDFILYQNQSWVPKKMVKLEETINKKSININIDDDFVRFIACYISEGNTRGDRVVVFTFHIDKDMDLIEFVKEYATNKLNSQVKSFSLPHFWGDYVIKIEIFNSQLAKFLKKYCGYTSANKFISNDVLGKSDHLLLDTLIACDGYIKGSCRTYTTVSRKLAYQVLHLSLGLGFNSSVSKYKSYTDKNGVNHQSCYRVYITNSSKMGISIKKIKEGTCIKIRDIKKRSVDSTKVYNITVSETNKYTIDGLLVNNCDGTGKDFRGNSCSFCSGKGKVGLTPCKNCNGEKRILGKQKLTKIKLTGEETKIEAMGHYSKDEVGKCGYLMLIKKIII